MKLIFALTLAMGLMGTAAFAQDASSSSAASSAPAPQPVQEKWDTDEGGLMVLEVLPDSFTGTYENDNGRIAGALKDGVWSGMWGEDGSSEECPTEQLGTKFWGKIAFTFDADRKAFTGKWGYCDAVPDSDWNGTKAAE